MKAIYWKEMPNQLAADECIDLGFTDYNEALRASATAPHFRRVQKLAVQESLYPIEDPRYDSQRSNSRWCVIVDKEPTQ